MFFALYNRHTSFGIIFEKTQSVSQGFRWNCWKVEAATGGVLLKKVFFKIVQSSQERTPATLLKERFSHRCFPVIFEQFLRAPPGGYFGIGELLFKCIHMEENVWEKQWKTKKLFG